MRRRLSLPTNVDRRRRQVPCTLATAEDFPVAGRGKRRANRPVPELDKIDGLPCRKTGSASVPLAFPSIGRARRIASRDTGSGYRRLRCPRIPTKPRDADNGHPINRSLPPTRETIPTLLPES